MFEHFSDWMRENIQMLTTSFFCAVLYIIAISKEPFWQRMMSGLSGFIAAIVFSPILAEALSNGKGIHIYSAGIALCGQFVPQLIQTSITKIKHTDIYEVFARFFKK